MVSEEVLRGYLLEEALAWMLRNTGYRVLEHAREDTDELLMRGRTLYVRGRGADHQVDVLGEFELTPAFSLPIRMFLEAKFKNSPCSLQLLRNAHGVIHDVNERFIATRDSQPHRRYQYVYTLFSTSGFAPPAQDYALAHQISLVDLSGQSFEWLRSLVRETATDLHGLGDPMETFSVNINRLRRITREMLRDGGIGARKSYFDPRDNPLEAFAQGLLRKDAELLMGFPASPFVLMFGSDVPARFIEYAQTYPNHKVRIRPKGSGGADEWRMVPWDDQDAYQLTFNLPERIQGWISEKEKDREDRAREFKKTFLPTITVYRRQEGVTRVYQLEYKPTELHR